MNAVQLESVHIWAQSLLLQRSDLGHHTHGSPHYNSYLTYYLVLCM